MRRPLMLSLIVLLSLMFASVSRAQLIIYEGPQSREYPKLTAELTRYLQKGYYYMSLDYLRIEASFDPGIDTLTFDSEGRTVDLRAISGASPAYRQGVVQFDLRDIARLSPGERCVVVVHELQHVKDSWVKSLLDLMLPHFPMLTPIATAFRELNATDFARMRVWKGTVCPE